MSYRFMRVMVIFDLPVTTTAARKEYTAFRKYLIKAGFMMMQESVYCKMAPNATAADTIVDGIRKHKPSAGLVQVLRVTEKQFSKIECIVGAMEKDVLDSDERLVII